MLTVFGARPGLFDEMEREILVRVSALKTPEAPQLGQVATGKAEALRVGLLGFASRVSTGVFLVESFLAG